MMVSSRGIALIFGVLALVVSGTAMAQENLDANKTPAQLYASDCVLCHKSTRGLSRAGGAFGLESFLREHYTASRESAAAIAGYLRQVDRGPLPPNTRHSARPRHEDQRKAADKKRATDKKPAKPDAAKDSAKTTEKKTGQATAADKKKDAAKPAPKKPGEAKSSATKPAKPKAMDAEAKAAKPAATNPKVTKPKDAKPVE
jgi:type IV secretory pathway VirB10-like protein